MLEPACGDGSFLLPAIERLLTWHQAFPGVDLASMIRAYEFEPCTADALRKAVVVMLRKHGLTQQTATRWANSWVRSEDFLLSDVDVVCTHVVGNPPYMRWSLVPNPLRESYEKELPKAAAKGDLCLAFLWKASSFATGQGSRIGFLCADRWLRCAYGRDVRGELSVTYSLRTHIEVHGVPVFRGERKVGAYAAVTVLERGAGLPGTFGKASSIPDLRKLAAAKVESGTVGGSIWPTTVDGGARLATSDVRNLLDAIERVSSPLEGIGVSIRCGVALGVAKAFIATADADIERECLLPYLRSKDLRSDGSVGPELFVANVWTNEGTLLDLALAPRLGQHLASFRSELEDRACVAGATDWYRTIDKLDPGRIAEPKVLVAGMARRAKVAYDPGGHVAANALYCLVSRHWPLVALAATLQAGVLDLYGEVLAPRFSGGTKRFDGNVLRQVRLPEWNSVSVDLRSRIEARTLSDGFDAMLVADLFKLRNKSHRASVERILREIDESTRPVEVQL
ncbi:MAG: Eco57I restriction-modification methylase domain-containing protein [Sphingomonas sp.]